jgi:quercetin dioxygenase-like cupin family protein
MGAIVMRSSRRPSPGGGEPRPTVARTRRTPVTAFVVGSLMIVGAACSSSPAATPARVANDKAVSTTATTAPAAATTKPGTTTAPAVGGVVKDILGADVDPPGAPGRTLTLIRYTIQAAAKLAPHIHPGVQLASIQSGTLTYTVVSGTIPVKHPDGSTENLVGPITTTLHPGDAVTEVDGVVHFGANDTTEPVIILATLLTEDGMPLAVPVAQPAS